MHFLFFASQNLISTSVSLFFLFSLISFAFLSSLVWTAAPDSSFSVSPSSCDLPSLKSTSFRVTYEPKQLNTLHGAQLECFAYYKVMFTIYSDPLHAKQWCISLLQKYLKKCDVQNSVMSYFHSTQFHAPTFAATLSSYVSGCCRTVTIEMSNICVHPGVWLSESLAIPFSREKSISSLAAPWSPLKWWDTTTRKSTRYAKYFSLYLFPLVRPLSIVCHFLNKQLQNKMYLSSEKC